MSNDYNYGYSPFTRVEYPDEEYARVQEPGIADRYLVSNYGNVLNQKTQKFVAPYVNKTTGYKTVHMRRENQAGHNSYKTKDVHRMVLKAFDPKEDIENLQVNHKDGVKTNNNLSNLEWVTHSENIKEAYRLNLVGLPTSYDDEFVRQILTEYKESGLSLREFYYQYCEPQGRVKFGTLYKWATSKTRHEIAEEVEII